MFNSTIRILPMIFVQNNCSIDIDLEIKHAYEKYPFPWPNERQYDDYSVEDIHKTLALHEKLLREFFQEYNVSKGYFSEKVVLDLGAGVGWDSMVLAGMGAKYVHAVDNSITSITYGRCFSERLNIRNIKFWQSSLYDIGALNIETDIVISKGVLHHVSDLPRLIDAIQHVVGPTTKIFATHSSYSSRTGLYKYVNNQLAWWIGGDDLEKRIDVGIKLFRKWAMGTPSAVIRQKVNDYAGVYYMVRSTKYIKKAFEERQFIIDELPKKPFSTYIPYIENKLRNKALKTRGDVVKTIMVRTLFYPLRIAQFLATISKMIDQGGGQLFRFLFVFSAYMYIAKPKSDNIANIDNKSRGA